jgi:ribosomal-protein-serine acetyltransferase
MLSVGQFLFRPFNGGDAPSFTAAVRESEATVGKWMSWAHAGYAESDALAWFAHCTAERANGMSSRLSPSLAPNPSVKGTGLRPAPYVER